MPAYCTEIPSEAQTNCVYAGDNAFASPSIVTTWFAKRGWLVIGARDDEEARHAVPLAGSGSDPVPGLKESHPLNKTLICTQLPVESRQSGKVRIVRAIYATLDISAENPLAAAPDLFVDWGEESEEFDQDAELGIPIVDGVGDPFDSNPQRPTADISIIITRNEPFYPMAKAIAFKNKCNKGAYNIPNFGSVDDGQAYCEPIRLANPFKPKPPFVTCVYTLRIREDGWRTRNLNAGWRGWTSKSSGNVKRGLWSDTGQEVTKPVLLLPTGVPINDGYTAEGDAIEANPSPLPSEVFEYPFQDNKNVPDAFKDINYLRFNRFRKVDFATLFKLDNTFKPFG